MINIAKNSVFKLKEIPIHEVREDALQTLTPDEEILGAFRTFRDQFIFTDRRIITVDVEGITGSRVSFATIPYNSIIFYSVQVPSFLEFIFPDKGLILHFANGVRFRFEFSKDVNIQKISQCIANQSNIISV